MEEEVKTLILNDKEFAVVDELEYKGKKYMYLVELTGEEIQIVEEFMEDLNTIIKTVNDKKLLDILEVEFAKRF
ncbi:MAG: hypothetical protein MSH48_00645 [Mollicutes bacterium]|nr:hypothetical protein [Mollicutes bacterium]